MPPPDKKEEMPEKAPAPKPQSLEVAKESSIDVPTQMHYDYGSEALKSSPVDEIWGSYLAKWKDDASKYEVKKPT